MARTNGATNPKAATVGDLTDQIDALKTDIASITEILADIGSTKRDEAASKVRATAEDVKARGEKHLSDAQARAEDMGQQAVEAVRQQPAAEVGIAVGVGFLMGFLTSRK